jgi:hypothetical protein
MGEDGSFKLPNKKLNLRITPFKVWPWRFFNKWLLSVAESIIKAAINYLVLPHPVASNR